MFASQSAQEGLENRDVAFRFTPRPPAYLGQTIKRDPFDMDHIGQRCRVSAWLAPRNRDEMMRFVKADLEAFINLRQRYSICLQYT